MRVLYFIEEEGRGGEDRGGKEGKQQGHTVINNISNTLTLTSKSSCIVHLMFEYFIQQIEREC